MGRAIHVCVHACMCACKDYMYLGNSGRLHMAALLCSGLIHKISNLSKIDLPLENPNPHIRQLFTVHFIST